LLDAALAELASFFAGFQGRAFPLVEALGVRPVNVQLRNPGLRLHIDGQAR
jgi:hypothetical protein